VLKAGVHVIFQAKAHYVVEMAVVHVSVNSEQSFEYYFDNALEALRERNFYFCREDGFIIQLAFHPRH